MPNSKSRLLERFYSSNKHHKQAISRQQESSSIWKHFESADNWNIGELLSPFAFPSETFSKN